MTEVLSFQRLFRTALFLGLCHVAVLDAQHDVGAGAAAGGLLEELTSLQGRGQACDSAVSGPPCLAVVIRLPVTPAIRSVPNHLLWPGTVPQDISAIKRVDGCIVLHPAL